MKADDILKWENILPPEEMKSKFGPKYFPIEIRNREVYVSSEYFIKEALKSGEADFNQLVREIERVFLSLNRDLRLVKDRRRYKTNYPISISRR